MVEGTRGPFEQVRHLDIPRKAIVEQCRCRDVWRALQTHVGRIQAGDEELGMEERAALLRLNGSKHSPCDA